MPGVSLVSVVPVSPKKEGLEKERRFASHNLQPTIQTPIKDGNWIYSISSVVLELKLNGYGFEVDDDIWFRRAVKVQGHHGEEGFKHDP